MKKILITGKNSYVGNSFEKWVAQWPEEYEVDKISIRTEEWKELDFGEYDTVLLVAGIAHQKETVANKHLYYEINRDLAYEVAKKAKQDNVKHFVFLSSMSVYGMENGIIKKDTPLKPNSAYGKSKLEAENLIEMLGDKEFIIATLRPPMIYGEGCRGNYTRLAALALKTPIFPNINNKRSMIYIDNLTEFIKQLVDNESGGLFFPQNKEYVNTSELVNLISKSHHKKIKLVNFFNPLLNILSFSTTKKIFGDLVYEESMSEYISNYRMFNLKESIKLTEV